MLTFAIIYAFIGLGFIMGSYRSLINAQNAVLEKTNVTLAVLVSLVGLTGIFLFWPYFFVKNVWGFTSNKDHKELAKEIFKEIVRGSEAGENPKAVLDRVVEQHKLNDYDKKAIAPHILPMLAAHAAKLEAEMENIEKEENQKAGSA